MKVEITGDALQLLNDFIHYATGENVRKSVSYELADAMYYDYDAFFQRAKLLEQQINKQSLSKE